MLAPKDASPAKRSERSERAVKRLASEDTALGSRPNETLSPDHRMPLYPPGAIESGARGVKAIQKYDDGEKAGCSRGRQQMPVQRSRGARRYSKVDVFSGP